MPACSRTDTVPPCRWVMPTSVGSGSFGASAAAASWASAAGVVLKTSSGSSAAKCASSPAWRGKLARLLVQPLGDPAGGVLERLVLQQPGEEQVAGLEQGHVLVGFQLVCWAAGARPSGPAAWRR